MARPQSTDTTSAGSGRGPLLLSKLIIPPLRPRLVQRQRLIEQLDRGAHGKLTLISAPAGFGKTTLAAAWACRSAREAAWLSLDEADVDPAQFLRYLCAALQQADGRIGRTLIEALSLPQLPLLSGLVTLLANDLACLPLPLLLVLDDYQLAACPAVHQVVHLLLDRAPPTLHLVICTREDPSLPLARLRARGQLNEIRTDDLRFTSQEAESFYRGTMGVALPREAVHALELRTEGWAAGLQLAGLALQQCSGSEQTLAFIERFRGDDPYVAGYLVSEVLFQQPCDVRAFLRQTAVLGRLTAPLCDAVTGRTDSQAMLERLGAANLFISPLDSGRTWYRYDPLFVEVLRGALPQHDRGQLHRRAACWYGENGHPGRAIHHALAYANSSGDTSLAEVLLRASLDETIGLGHVATARRWLDALPDAQVRGDGVLATHKGWVLAVSGELGPAQEYAAAASEQALGPTPDRGRLLALQGFLALLARQAPREALELSTGALQHLGPQQGHWCGLALWTMAEAQERTGPITDAISTLRQAVRTPHVAANAMLGATLQAFLAVALHAHGRRREAVAVCEEGIAAHGDGTGQPSPLASLLFSELGSLHYEADRVELARQCLDQGLALSEQLGLGSDLTFSLGRLAQVLYAQGETKAALSTLRRAQQLAVETGLVDVGWPLALEVNLRLAEGDLAAAVAWSECAGLSPDDSPRYLHVDQHLTYARLLLAQGELAHARRWLSRLERFLEARQLYRSLLTVYVLQALTANRARDWATALARMGRAVVLAAPEDLCRAFIDEGPPVAHLLCAARDAAPAFVDRILARIPEASQAPRPASHAIVEPLSERELEVLHLIAAGLTNHEIASELYIALGTAKRHANHIYGKLGVHNRVQAVSRAQELRILGPP